MSKRRWIKALVWTLAAILAVLAGALSERLEMGQEAIVANQPGLYAVEEISDGDTIIVNMNGTREIIRMIGVDTPETHHPDRPLECYGTAASEYTRNLLEGKNVRLQADPLNTNRDRYDRLLRYVYLSDGTLVQQKLIGEGYGFAYTLFPFEKTGQFIALQNEAKMSVKGLWSACQVRDENGAYRTNPAT